MPRRGTALAILLVLLVALFVGAFSALQALSSASASVQHTEEVRIAVERLVNTIEEAETNERGFVLTGDASFHEFSRSGRRA